MRKTTQVLGAVRPSRLADRSPRALPHSPQHSMSNTLLPRALVLLSLAGAGSIIAPSMARAQLATPTAATVGPTATPRPLSAREHADELAAAEDGLRAMEKVEDEAKRSLKPLDGFENPRVVARADGKKLEFGGHEWKHRREEAVGDSDGDGASDSRAQVSRREVEAARRAVEKRREAVEAWAFPPNGKYFQPDESARAAVLEWEKQKLIETGPPAWQRAWHDFVRWAYELLDRLSAWLDSLLKRSPNVSAPKVDTKKVETVFFIVLTGIVAGAAFLTWRALGGRVRRGGKGARDVLLEGEDQALLRLPPDELLDRAQQFALQSNFREALRHRYLSLLLLLDARGVWRYDRRRTNWEHIARLKGANASRAGIDALSELTLRFDRVRYGNENCDQSAWLSFDQDAQATLEMLSRQAGAGATNVEARG